METRIAKINLLTIKEDNDDVTFIAPVMSVTGNRTTLIEARTLSIPRSDLIVMQNKVGYFMKIDKMNKLGLL